MTRPVDVYGASDSLPEEMNGVALLVDKPKGWSSFRVVSALRRIVSIRKIGHAGTLDPMATGLLICCIGRTATRQIDRFVAQQKTYTGRIRLGQVTPSFDAETDVIETHDWQHLTDEVLEETSQSFIGSIEQKPPMYSAVKVGGERLYKKARRGESIDRPNRTVQIYSFSLLDRNGPDVDFEVSCSKGTYIRTLAHDWGRALGVGAHLIALRRTAIGAYSVEDAWKLEQLEESLAGNKDECV